MNPLAIILLLSGAFFVIFVAVSSVMYFSRGSESKPSHSAKLFSSDGDVGVIELKGVIMDSKKMLKSLKNFEDDPDVKAVVLRLDSPGGAVGPSQEIYQAVRDYKKPIVASMGSVAASGAFYIACGAKKVFANPGTITGSIGVIMEFTDIEKLLDWAKVKLYSIKTGRFKDIGAPYREMTADERALLQNMVDDVLSQFTKAVAEGRKIELEDVVRIADGRIFSGKQAKAIHLVDQLGTLKDAVDDAAKEAGIKGEPKVVYPAKHHRGVLDLLEDVNHDDDSESDSSYSGGEPGLIQSFRRLLGVSEQSASPIHLLPPGIYWLWRGGY